MVMLVMRKTLLTLAVCCLVGSAAAQVGSIRGIVRDKDFDSPLPSAQVEIVDLKQRVTTTDQGNFVFSSVRPGTYTLSFSKQGYVRQLRANVIVKPGQLTDLTVSLSGDFTDMEEFVVQDMLQVGGDEGVLLQERFDSPSFLNSIGSDLLGKAGASTAADGVALVAGASIKDGKSAVIRGLPDRYVSSQMNGVRLPTGDADKRAVELDQFPAAVIESLQVVKTFTPDQQGDASGGAVNIRLRGMPTDPFMFRYSIQHSGNSQVSGRNRFLSYEGGSVGFWGRDNGRRRQQLENLGQNWDGAVGVNTQNDAPLDYKTNVSTGGFLDFGDGWKVGGFASFFYEHDTKFYDNGVDDSLWVERPGGPMTPRAFQGSVQDGDFATNLFDVTRATQLVRWGTLLSGGIESENHKLGVVYLYTRTAQDAATLSEDTRGKQYFFPGYDPSRPNTPGHLEPQAARYLRFETLNYTERTTRTLQFNGQHTFDIGKHGIFRSPEVDWTVADSRATFYQPDRREFGSQWIPGNGDDILPEHRGFKPGANFTLGNLQRIWQFIEEESDQYFVNLKIPFELKGKREGYLKFGYFSDKVERTFDQDSFSNFSDNSLFNGPYEQRWSSVFQFEDHPVSESTFDVDYDGSLEVTAWYGMIDLPITKGVNLIGGVRVERTQLGVTNTPEEDATWFPDGSLSPVALNPGDGDVDIDQTEALPSIGFVVTPADGWTVRGAYNETIARQSFKEITPILQSEFLGGPIFIGNPGLTLSRLQNYDLRVEYVPAPGGLLSVSWFHKELEDPIEYVQVIAAAFNYTTAVNYPEGRITGWEFEARQEMGQVAEFLSGLTLGANATLLDSRVSLSEDDAARFRRLAINTPQDRRKASFAPEYLVNLNLTYENEYSGTNVGLFYTITGDTLIAGAGEAQSNFLPPVYAAEVDRLNLTVAQQLGRYLRLRVQLKNLTDPAIKTVYRSPYIGDDVLKTSRTAGIDYSITLGGSYTF